MPRQYITVKFRSGDARSYTYHNDGEPVAAGDPVKLPPRKDGDGWTKGVVHAIGVEPPTNFATKAILGRVEPEVKDEQLL